MRTISWLRSITHRLVETMSLRISKALAVSAVFSAIVRPSTEIIFWSIEFRFLAELF